MKNRFAGGFVFGVMNVMSVLGVLGALSTASAAQAGLQDVARASDGSILRLSQKEALRYCASLHLRLPTIRELAVEATRLGAQKVRETAYPDVDANEERVRAEIHSNSNDGFEAIYRRGVNGLTVLSFYSNSKGYQAPTSELGHHFFWSSSVHPFNEWLAYGLAGAVGQVEFESLSYTLNSAVRCFALGE